MKVRVKKKQKVLYLIDWKTGKYKDPKWQDYDQLMYYAVYFFKRYPTIDKIKISFVYIEHHLENDMTLERKYLDRYINDLKDSINDIETDKEFEKNPSKLCEYCDFISTCIKDE